MLLEALQEPALLHILAVLELPVLPQTADQAEAERAAVAMGTLPSEQQAEPEEPSVQEAAQAVAARLR